MSTQLEPYLPCQPADVAVNLRSALSAIDNLERALSGVAPGGDLWADPHPERAKVDGKPIGKMQVKFAVDDLDDARDALLACGRRYGLTDLEVPDL